MPGTRPAEVHYGSGFVVCEHCNAIDINWLSKVWHTINEQIHLPKLLIDSLIGFYFVSFEGDTAFCSEELIDSLEGVLDLEKFRG